MESPLAYAVEQDADTAFSQQNHRGDQMVTNRSKQATVNIHIDRGSYR